MLTYWGYIGMRLRICRHAEPNNATFNLMKIMSEHQLEVLHRKLNSNGSSGQARG